MSAARKQAKGKEKPKRQQQDWSCDKCAGGLYSNAPAHVSACENKMRNEEKKEKKLGLDLSVDGVTGIIFAFAVWPQRTQQGNRPKMPTHMIQK